MSNIKLGLSGCKIELLSKNIIRKHSKDLSYNARLVSQANKQKYFNSLYIPNISSPQVYSINQNNLYYFDMEYCTGKNYFQFLDNCSIKDSQDILCTLFRYFDFIINNSQPLEYNYVKDKIIQKLQSLASKSEYSKIINCIIETYDELGINNVRSSFCHGDLTFSNILFSKGHIYFIDFLDSFIDSYYIDFAKVKQDIYYHWAININHDESLRILQNFSFFWYNICERYSEIISSETFDLFDFLNLIRIEPYANETHREILRHCIRKHKYYVNFNSTNGRSVIQIS
jgi:thiamine kinase-like enzyme